MASPKDDTLTSLQELYTDFDQWVVKLRRFIAKRIEEVSAEKTIWTSNEEKLKIQEMLVHGIFLQKIPLKSHEKFINNIDSFVSQDYVILAIMGNRKYKSKL